MNTSSITFQLPLKCYFSAVNCRNDFGNGTFGLNDSTFLTFLSFTPAWIASQSLWKKNLQKFHVPECFHADHTTIKSDYEWQAISHCKSIVYIFSSFVKTSIAYMASSKDIQWAHQSLTGVDAHLQNGSLPNSIRVLIRSPISLMK